MYNSARRRAEESGVRFAITPADVEAVYPADGICPVLGVRLRVEGSGGGPTSATLDRVNNTWGYERGNIAVISMAANRAKSAATAAELDQVAAWMRRQGLD